MTIGLLGQYFRSFMVKLTMIESQLGQLELGGQWSSSPVSYIVMQPIADNASFAILLELKDGKVPTKHGEVRKPTNHIP
jgi:mitotic spindle assembly checkpoint protein MAD2B